MEVAPDVGERSQARMKDEEESEFMYEDGTNSSNSESERTSTSNPQAEGKAASARNSSRKRRRKSESYCGVLKKYLEMKVKTEKRTSSMLFLESLHDDIEKLSRRGQRTFKLKVQELLNTMLDQEGA